MTAEDEQDELHRRIANIVQQMTTPLRDLNGLAVASFADEDAILAALDGKGTSVVKTELYDELDNVLGEIKPTLLLLDTLADVYGANEIIRQQVRAFVAMLRRLAMKHGGTSGSTAWSNAVRSRLYLERIYEADGSESNPDARVLRIMKQNYGRTGGEARLLYQRGIFVAADYTGGDPLTQQVKAERVFLELLTAYTEEGRPVSAASGANYAPSVFAKDTARSHGIRKVAFRDAMNRLFATGRIRIEEVGPNYRRRKVITVVT